MSPSCIFSIGIAVPKHRYSQEDLASFMKRYLQLDDQGARKLNVLYSRSGISFRHSVLPDFEPSPNHSELFLNEGESPTLSRRLSFYERHAIPLAAESVANCLEEFPDGIKQKITHLIVVSCTGLSAPGLDISLSQSLQLSPNISRMAVNFMGCYAAFHGLKMADFICRSQPDAMVLVVTTELCSLHFQNVITDEHLVVNSLFADGSAALLISGEELAKKHTSKYVRILSSSSALIPEGSSLMTWQPAENGFLMGLDVKVPSLIEREAAAFVNQSLKQINSGRNDVTHWAIHPGGKKILSAVESGLGLKNEDLNTSHFILENFGNMSSPSVLFVLKKMMEEDSFWNENNLIASMAFGPGITVELATMKPVVN